MEYIFLSGVHGVGKSTLLERISKDKNITIESISNLIRQAGNEIKESNKLTKNIPNNQNLWKQELNKKILLDDKKIILDGHFCLLNSKGEVVVLPDNTFEGTKMSKIIFKKEKNEIIKQRIENRDNIIWELETIKLLQSLEEKRAIFFSRKFDIPLFIFDNNELYKDLLEFI
ncbi:ATP-binding protein [Facklamia miroungae]|uniref:Adenylate kinase n=1 Tax=Facklamia miroungae TaxID=120956 RepID=A0A1G7RXV6_9LACT|nr:ATP-binding protein [Facklamia miroungae]NKZ29235.1 AAA family ATPase [Facklamia miroungae]SDG15597.1 adenylate kinase [Facklamia miroungae]